MAKIRKVGKKKDNVDVVKEIKKRKVPILVTIVLALSILVIILFLGIKINFALKDELKILLDPQDTYISNDYKTPFVLNFTITNDNFFFCNSRCDFEFKDISTGRIIENGAIELESDQSAYRDYEIQIDEIGTGQKIYVFEIACNNVRSAVCTTGEKKRLKSAIATVDYGLSSVERTLKEQSNLSLTDKLNEIRLMDSGYLSNREMISKIGSPPFLVEANDDALYDIKVAKNKAETLESLWKSEDYKTLSENLGGFNPSSSVADVKSEILEYIERYNEAYSLLNNLSSDPMISVMQEFYSRNNDHRVDSFIGELNSIRYRNYSEDIKDEILALNNTLSVLKASYSLDQKNFLEEIEYRINKKALIVQTLTNATIQGDICERISILNTAIADHNQDLVNATSDDEFELWAEQKISNQTPLNITDFNVKIDTLNVSYCLPFNKLIVDSTVVPLMDDSYTEVESNFSTELVAGVEKCCFKGICGNCIVGLTPVVFIHGHLVNKENSPDVSLAAFAKMQHRMDDYINGGQLDIKSDTPWTRSLRPISLRASYYYISYYDLGAYMISTQVTTGIENYAIRLKEIVEVVKRRTGSDKVIIVAHSMGGLVAREYMALFGDESIEKLILIATPNYGVKGSVKDFCGILGSDQECQDLAMDSIFLKRLNSRDPPDVDVYTIRATGCDMDGEDGDGIALAANVPLDFATNYEIQGSCTNLLENDLHSNVLDPDLYPQTYDLIIDILN